MTRENYETLKATVKVNTDDIIDYVEMYRDTLTEMCEDDYTTIKGVKVWCLYNYLNDEDVEEIDRCARYELGTKHLSVRVDVFTECSAVYDVAVIENFIFDAIEEDSFEEEC